MKQQLIPEWAESEAVILAWPDEQTDWAPWLDDVRQCYVRIISALHESGVTTLLLCRASALDTAKQCIPSHLRVLIVEADYNDTWVRDYGFLTVNSDHGPTPVEFTFNGWGNKFDAGKDNTINQAVLANLCKLSLQTASLVIEGGALEIDSEGHLLSTKLCLSNPERNGDTAIDTYNDILSEVLGANTFTVLEHGHLEGDDTDGHIDTLARFTPTGGIVVQGCDNRPEDSHYASLSAMIQECLQYFPDKTVFSLPLCELFNEDDDRLPASYANYLVCNDVVLAPIYGEPEDAKAVEVLTRAYPEHTVKALDCSALVKQFGSLHCISMQVPKHTLKADVIALAQHGVFHYAP